MGPIPYPQLLEGAMVRAIFYIHLYSTFSAENLIGFQQHGGLYWIAMSFSSKGDATMNDAIEFMRHTI